MSADTVGWHVPPVVTLDDLAAMNDADEYHRYEISPEGVLSITPLGASAHAFVASRLTGWLFSVGVAADRMTQAVVLRIPGSEGVGGRIPDLIVWGAAPAGGVWLPATDVLLVIEIISPGSEGLDTVTKRKEYAAAGIPQYWTVDHDQAQTVTMHRLSGDRYAVQAVMPLAWVFNTGPAEHDLS